MLTENLNYLSLNQMHLSIQRWRIGKNQHSKCSSCSTFTARKFWSSSEHCSVESDIPLILPSYEIYVLKCHFERKKSDQQPGGPVVINQSPVSSAVTMYSNQVSIMFAHAAGLIKHQNLYCSNLFKNKPLRRIIKLKTNNEDTYIYITTKTQI